MNYQIHNGSRAIHNRSLRSQMPQHGGHKQYVCKAELRLIRGRPLEVSDLQLQEHLEELQEKQEQGLVYVTTVDGHMVDLLTMEVSPSVPESPRPTPALDSAANDKAGGEVIPRFAGDLPPPKDFEMPVAPSAASLEAEVDVLTPEPPGDESSDDQEPEVTPGTQKSGKRKAGR